MQDAKHAHHTPQGSLRLLWGFIFVVIFAIAVSIGYRVYTIISTSVYDGKQVFVTYFSYKNNLDIIAIHPNDKSVSHVEVRGGTSPENTFADTGIIPDVVISLSETFDITKLSHYFLSGSRPNTSLKQGLTIYDRYRLSNITKNITKANVISQKIHLPFDKTTSLVLFQELFQDALITQENKTVAISNGTGVAGLGVRLEWPLQVMGINVISVTNPDSVKDISEIRYNGDKSYTVTRLARLLNLPLRQDSSQTFSDIIIQLGKDRKTVMRF